MLYVERSLCVFTLHVSNENGCAGRSEVNLSSTRKFFSLKIGTWSRQRVTTLDAAMRSSHHYCRSQNSLLFLAQATRYRPSFQLSHVGGGLGSASFSARAVGGHASRRASLGRGARWIHRTLSCTMSTWNSASPRQAGEAPFPLGMQEGLVGLSITASKKNATAPALVVAAPRNFANCHWPRGNTEWHPWKGAVLRKLHHPSLFLPHRSNDF